MAAANGRSKILYGELAKAGKAGMTRLAIREKFGWTAKAVDAAAQHLEQRDLVLRCGCLTWRVTEKPPTWGQHTPILNGSDRRGVNAKRQPRIVEPRSGEPIITRDTTVYGPRWASVPSQPPIGFRDVPLGATLVSGWGGV